MADTKISAFPTSNVTASNTFHTAMANMISSTVSLDADMTKMAFWKGQPILERPPVFKDTQEADAWLEAHGTQ